MATPIITPISTPSAYPKEITKTLTFLAQDAADEAFLCGNPILPEDQFRQEVEFMAQECAVNLEAIDGVKLRP